MGYGKKIKRAQKRGNTARVERLKIKQDKQKAKRVTLYTPGKKNGTVTIGRQKFNKLATMDGNFGKQTPDTFHREKNGAPMNGTGNFYTESQRSALKTLRKKLGFDDFSKGNLGKAQRAMTYANFAAPTAVTPTAATTASTASTSTSFDNQLQSIQNDYASENASLQQQILDQQSMYDSNAMAFDKQINNLNNTVANASNMYDPTKNMGSSNNINPALSVQEQNKSLAEGTQRYNRNSKLSINNLNL
jgi:hypothetical protein